MVSDELDITSICDGFHSLGESIGFFANGNEEETGGVLASMPCQLGRIQFRWFFLINSIKNLQTRTEFMCKIGLFVSFLMSHDECLIRKAYTTRQKQINYYASEQKLYW